MMSKIFASAFFCHICILFACAEGVDVRVILDNGDSLSGRLVSESDTELRLLVDYLGEIALPLDRISDQERSLVEEVLEVVDMEPHGAEQVAVVADTADKSAPVAGPVVEEGERVDAEAGHGFLSGVLATLAQLPLGKDPLPEWDKRIQFGMNSSSGRKDQSTYNYRLDLQRKYNTSRMNFKADYSYGEANGATTQDRMITDFRWRKDISPGVFYEAQSIYSSDAIKLIDANVEQKLGLGTRFVESKISTLSAGLGASGRWRSLIGASPEEVDYLVNLFQDWDYKFSERVSLKQDFKFAMPLEESDDYEVNFTAAVSSAVTQALNLSIRYEVGFDNSRSTELKEDRRFISALGYAF